MKTDKKRKYFERRKKNRYFQTSLFLEYQPTEIVPLPFLKQHARTLMGISLVISDIVSILVSFYLAITLYGIVIREISTSLYIDLIYFVGIFIFIYTWYGLYPGVGLNPIDEIKKLINATSNGFLILLAFTFFGKTSETYSRLIFGSAWLIALVLVQLDRWVLRVIGRYLDFWGEPVAIVGSGTVGRRIAKYLRNNVRLGLKPFLLLDGYADFDRQAITSINCLRISTLIVVPEEMNEDLQQHLIYEQRYGRHRRKGEKEISRIILISELSWVGSLGIVTHDLNGILGLEIKQNLLNKWAKFLKRSLDLFLSTTALLFSLTILPLIALAIRLDSPGPIFYNQRRLGRGGKEFSMWKFRTMVKDADSVLNEYLEKNPEMKAEWRASYKLKNDPRVTRVGRFLRKWSIDEFPQIWNVFTGEMSLVGPRPIVESEIKFYRNVYRLYKQVSPGLSGMWQISGRTDTTYNERVNLDEYYIRNWSIWLDLYILVRTVWIVLTRQGAY